MSEKIRINKYIASSGSYSRRGADELIKDGRVKINDKLITEPGYIVQRKDKVYIDNKLIKSEAKKYFVFNKPAGYITTKTDPLERKTIFDILPEEFKSYNTAGRLDRASTGLLILTNDGELIQKLTHPKIRVPKVYRVTVEGKIKQQDILTLEKGIEIEDGKIAYAEVLFLGYESKITTLQMTLYQGYNKQIRKMMEKVEHPVISLKRIVHATIDISGVEKGQYRKLLPKEIGNLNSYLDKKLRRGGRNSAEKTP